ncbi:MlaC/ttg2D family ABC transporter substrate-binding protein [Aquabacterium sp.]|uniref:MlaC/ttg2D family ABC transporter substrate-binding protein n=1 Tax=Aquabacterium sp. TaxID=1872578 RepID=UPI004037B646
MQSAHSYKLSCTTRLLASLALSLAALSSATAAAEAVAPAAAVATAQAPDAFIKAITAEVFATVKADKAIQSGDIRKVIQVVDTKIMPNVNFQRMTASAVGRGWRQATPEQQKRLQDEFKTLLVYTYAGAVSQIKDQTVEYKPMRNRPEDTDVVVRTVVRGKGDPIQLDYRLEKAGDGWKIYDVNVLGAWLVQTYQSSFAQEVNASGIDGLIGKLVERNKQLAAKKVAG